MAGRLPVLARNTGSPNSPPVAIHPTHATVGGSTDKSWHRFKGPAICATYAMDMKGSNKPCVGAHRYPRIHSGTGQRHNASLQPLANQFLQ